MGKRRSTLDSSTATDLFDVESLGEQFGVRLTLHTLLRGALLVYAVAFALHIAYNVYEGGHMSAMHIENQQKLHGACIREEIIRTTEWKKCQRAKIEKDMSVTWTTLNHVLHTTTPCIAGAGCYALFIDFIQATGWLFIGVALVVAVLLYAVARHLAAPQPTSAPAFADTRELQPYSRADSHSYFGQRLVEMKHD